MMFKRRTLMRWGFRAGTTLAYFADPDLGPQRREAVLATIEPFGAKTRLGPVINWLRSLNAGEITRPPTREEMEAARAAAAIVDEAGEDAVSDHEPDEKGPAANEVLIDPDDGAAEEEPVSDEEPVDRLTVVEHS